MSAGVIDRSGVERVAAAADVSPAVQDYLKAIYRLAGEGGAVTTLRLAAELGITGPSVTNMVKRLTELGFLRHEPYRAIELTAAGERIASEVVRHHRLLELYLVTSLGYGWDEAHVEAERLEHHISEALEARLDAALGHPLTDPHGDPIPTADGSVGEARVVPLTDRSPGEPAPLGRLDGHEDGGPTIGRPAVARRVPGASMHARLRSSGSSATRLTPPRPPAPGSAH